MERADFERIVRNEQAIKDIRDDVRSLKEAMLADSRLLRSVENAVNGMLSGQRRNREAETEQYKRLELRIQVLTLALIFVGLMVSILAYLHS